MVTDIYNYYSLLVSHIRKCTASVLTLFVIIINELDTQLLTSDGRAQNIAQKVSNRQLSGAQFNFDCRPLVCETWYCDGKHDARDADVTIKVDRLQKTDEGEKKLGQLLFT